MKTALKCTVLAIAVLSCNALPSGIPYYVSPGINASSSPSKQANCTNIENGVSPQCYLDLNINGYFEYYNTTIGLETCSPSETWSTCYQVAIYSNSSSKSPNLKTINQQHNCANLTTSTSNSGQCTQPRADQQDWTPDDFYGAFNIWSVQHHISVWAQAIAAASSRPAITTVAASDTIADSEAQSATSVLSSLILKYTINKEADEGLVRLLEAEPNSTKVPKRPKSTPQRVPSSIEEPSATAWQPILQARLAEVLALAMNDFDFFLETVREGAFSTTGLAVVGQLTEAMSKHPS